MSFVNIGNFWKTQLDTLKTQNYITDVYNYVPREVKNWPYIIIIPTDWVEVYTDMIDNDNNYPFLIKIVQNNLDNPWTAEADVRLVVDKVFEIVRKNYTFTFTWGKVHKVTFSYARWRSDQQYKMRMCDLNVNNFVLTSTI